MQEFDYIIVGGGSAGCVLANKLSESPNNRVCLIEAGKKDNHWQVHLPLAVISLMGDKVRNWRLESEPEPFLNNRKIYNPRGKTLGGSSSINAMLYVRGQKEDYDHWQALGNNGWSYDEVLPYFKALEHNEVFSDEYHGQEGLLNVADSRSKPEINDLFINATASMGFPINQDFNGKHQEGVGYYQVTQKDGLRCSSARAFLTPTKGRKNLTIFTELQVEKLLIEGDVAKGVQARYKHRKQTLIATKEVILSAGAFNSPQLLMLSGIGSKDELAQHNIDIVKELPGVGKNLQDHIDILSVIKTNYTQSLAYRPKAIWWGIKQSIEFLRGRSGILTSAIAESGAFLAINKEQHRPNIQLHFIPAAMDDHSRNEAMLLNYGAAIHACLLRPKSRGTVSLHSNDVRENPKILLNMLSHPDDMEDMIEAVKLSRKIFDQAPFAPFYKKEIFPGKTTQSDEQIAEFIRAKANTIYHPVGTCKMGSDAMSVVDNELKVHGIKHLRVVDASIMPTLISGNTNAPTMMIAAKAADLILAANQD